MLEPRWAKTSLSDQGPARVRWPSGAVLLSRLERLRNMGGELMSISKNHVKSRPDILVSIQRNSREAYSTVMKFTEKSGSTAAMAGRRTPPPSPVVAGKRSPLSPALAGKRSPRLSPRRASPSRKLFFSHVPMKALSNRSPKMEPGATKRLGELLDSAPPRLQSSLTARAKRRKSRLSDAAQTDAGAKQFLHSRRRTCRPKELKLKDGAWPQEVFELVKSVFGICTSFFEREILFHTVAKIAAVLRRNLRKKARKNGEAILKCLVQDAFGDGLSS
eukprot:s339_g4.t1